MEIFEKEMAQVREQFPEYGEGWRITAAGIELVEAEGTADEILEQARELEAAENLFAQDAIADVLEKTIIVTKAPAGCAFYRLQKDGEPPVTLMLRVRPS